MKNLTCVWRNIYNTARATHSRYYKHFAKHACDFSLILLEPCNFLYKFNKLLYTDTALQDTSKNVSNVVAMVTLSSPGSAQNFYKIAVY